MALYPPKTVLAMFTKSCASTMSFKEVRLLRLLCESAIDHVDRLTDYITLWRFYDLRRLDSLSKKVPKKSAKRHEKLTRQSLSIVGGRTVCERSGLSARRVSAESHDRSGRCRSIQAYLR